MRNICEGFTMLELLIATSILASVLIIVSGTFIKINESVFDANKATSIFSDINDFTLEQSFLPQTDNYIYIDSTYDFVLLEKNGINVIYGVFKDDGNYYSATIDNTRYEKQKFGYFKISDNYKDYIISNGINGVLGLKYYDGKLFDSLDVESLEISLVTYNSVQLAFLSLKFIKEIPKTENNIRIELPLDKFILLNIAL